VVASSILASRTKLFSPLRRWHLLSLLSRFGKSNSNSLLAALYLLTAPTHLELSSLVLVHYLFNFLLRTSAIFSWHTHIVDLQKGI
jgi:hypothetical protein